MRIKKILQLRDLVIYNKTYSSFEVGNYVANQYNNHRSLYHINKVYSSSDNALKPETARSLEIFPFMIGYDEFLLSSVFKNYSELVFKENSEKFSSVDYRKFSNFMFICAPENEMLSKNGFEEIKRIKTEDPFICSLTDYGVVIHTMWGPEANDGVLEKYKKCSERS